MCVHILIVDLNIGWNPWLIDMNMIDMNCNVLIWCVTEVNLGARVAHTEQQCLINNGSVFNSKYSFVYVNETDLYL